jgi:hypothetical protein
MRFAGVTHVGHDQAEESKPGVRRVNGLLRHLKGVGTAETAMMAASASTV